MELMVRRSSRFGFDVLEIGEQVEWGGLGGEFNGGVEERQGAIRAVHRRGFVDFGAEERAGSIVEGEKPRPGFPQMSETVAEVGSQCDASSHDGFVCLIFSGDRARPACHRVPPVLRWPIWRRGGHLWQKSRGWRLCGPVPGVLRCRRR